MGAVMDYLREVFGVPLSSDSNQVTLGAVALPLTQSNPDRFMVRFLNLSVNNIYIGFDSQVVITNGILLAANGGQVGFDARNDGDLSTRQWWGIAAAGAPVVYVVETRRTM